jgi:hypothetical protein
VRVPGRDVDLIPPAQADEAAAGDVFEVVEIEGEEEKGEYEDKDAAGVERSVGGGDEMREAREGREGLTSS